MNLELIDFFITQVVVRGCRALQSVIPGPDQGMNKFEWFSKKFRPIESTEGSVYALSEDELAFPRPYEWRLNMRTGLVKERHLVGTKFPLDFPLINGAFTGVKNKYSYAQVRDSIASSSSGSFRNSPTDCNLLLIWQGVYILSELAFLFLTFIYVQC